MKILTLILTLFGSSGFAYNGVVHVLRGSATLSSQGKNEKVKVGTTVNGGDTIKTDSASLVLIVMIDKAVLKLNENSELLVPLKKEDGVVLNAGSLFSKIPKQLPSEEFKVRTPSMVAGVRGTEFFTSFGPNKETSKDLWLCVNEGSVQVTSFANNKSVLVKEGEGILVPVGSDVTPPKKYEWTKGLNWNMDEAKGDLVNKSTINYKERLLKEQYD